MVCGSTERLEVDHIVPLSRGGTNDAENLRVLCSMCHHRRHAQPLGPEPIPSRPITDPPQDRDKFCAPGIRTGGRVKSLQPEPPRDPRPSHFWAVAELDFGDG